MPEIKRIKHCSSKSAGIIVISVEEIWNNIKCYTKQQSPLFVDCKDKGVIKPKLKTLVPRSVRKLCIK